MPDTARPLLVLTLLCLALFLPGFFSIQPMDLGETTTAVASRRMLDAGELLHLPPGSDAGPIGIHWLQSLCVGLLEQAHLAHRTGIPAYRLSSLLGAVLAVLATCHWGRAMIGRPAAFLAAAMLAGSALVVAQAHLATADAPLLAAVAGSMGLLGTAYLAPERFTAGRAAAFWLAVAAGVLLGGPVAVLVPVLAGTTLAVADRAAPWLRPLRPAWGVPLLLAAAAPWLIAAPGADGHGLQRLLRGDLPGWLPGAGQGPGLHLLGLGATAFPAIWILLPALPGLWRDRADSATRFLLAWAIPTWLLLETAGGTPGAILPAFPPLMLLGARWASGPHDARPARWLVVLAGLCLLGVAAAIGLGAVKIAEIDMRTAPYGAIAFVAAALLIWRLLAHGRAGGWRRAALLGPVLAAPLYAAVLAGTFTHLPVGRIADRIAGTAQRLAPGLPPDRFGVLGFDGPSLLFAYGPAVHLLADGTAAAGFLAGAPDRVLAVANDKEREFYGAAAARGIAVRERGQIISFDPLRWRFVIMIMYRSADLPG